METWIFISGLIEQAVLLLLLGLSIWSISIMIDRRRVFKLEDRSDIVEKIKSLLTNSQFQELHKYVINENDITSGTIRTIVNVPKANRERIESAVSSYLLFERERLEKGLTTLATLGANAPFIGLFGTVLGIIKAFAALSGDQSSGGASIMSGISIALIATAAGLFVAIPAVVAFNIASKKIQSLIQSCEGLKDLYLSRFSQENSSGQ